FPHIRRLFYFQIEKLVPHGTQEASWMAKTKKFLGMGALVIAVFAVALLTAGVASAQEPTPPVPRGPHGTGMMSTYYADLHAATAEALGLTVEELDAELDAGKTLVQIAGEQGV